MESLKEHLARQAYYLTYESEPTPTIIFHIRTDALETPEAVTMTKGVIAKVGRSHPNTYFETFLEKGWGFKDSSISRGTENGFLSIAFPIPPYWTYSENFCTKCEGKGYDDFWDDKNHRCHDCSGSGKEKIDTGNQTAKCAESMSLLLWYLFTIFIDRKELITSQDLVVDIITHIRGSAPLGGEISQWFQDACTTLKQKYDMIPGYRTTDFPRAHAILKSVYTHIVPSRLEPWCRAEIGHHGFYLEVPSNACYVAADGHGMQLILEDGTRFSCHNVDGTCQQLALFCGLIEFYHEVLEETLS